MRLQKMTIVFLSAFLIFGLQNQVNAEDTMIEISEKNFPDSTFRNYVQETVDVNDDMLLEQEEIMAVQQIDVSEISVQNLKGAELFTNLKYLNCANTNISELNIGCFKELETLDCHFTGLTQLDISQNKELKQLSCYGTGILCLDVTQNTLLELLDCSETKIDHLDISSNPRLRLLRCDDVGLTELDLSQNPRIESLSLINTGLEMVDVSGLSALEELYLCNVPIKQLDVSNNLQMKILNCDGTQITQLDVERNEKLAELHCMTDTLIVLHIGSNTDLTVYTEQEAETALETETDNFDLKTIFPLIDGEKIHDVIGARINDTSISDYTSEEPVSFSYECGISNAGEMERRIVLKMSIKEEEAPVLTPFTDVYEWQWYADTVREIYQKELMSGITNSLFGPEEPMTRAMAVTVLYRMAGQPICEKEADFSDVGAGTWYASAVSWAYDSGIISGYEDGRFGPDDYVTREQMTVMLCQYAEYKGAEVDDGYDISSYKDYPSVSGYALRSMGWAVDQGIIAGSTERELRPQDKASRAECAAMFIRFVKI